MNHYWKFGFGGYEERGSRSSVFIHGAWKEAPSNLTLLLWKHRLRNCLILGMAMIMTARLSAMAWAQNISPSSSLQFQPLSIYPTAFMLDGMTPDVLAQFDAVLPLEVVVSSVDPVASSFFIAPTGGLCGDAFLRVSEPSGGTAFFDAPANIILSQVSNFFGTFVVVQTPSGSIMERDTFIDRGRGRTEAFDTYFSMSPAVAGAYSATLNFSDPVFNASCPACVMKLIAVLNVPLMLSQQVDLSPPTCLAAPLTFSGSIDIEAPASARLAAASGDGQRGTVTKALARALIVSVTDAAGGHKSGTPIVFSIASAPPGATGQTLSTLSATTGSDGTASAALTFGNITGNYRVTATCSQCTPSSVAFNEQAQLQLQVSLSSGSIRPTGTETSSNENRVSVLVTALGVAASSDRVANYPVILVSTSVGLSGGHNHDGSRPTGHFNLAGNPSVTTQTTGPDGSFLIEYVASAFGGQERITASSAIDGQAPKAARDVAVEVPGLMDAELTAPSTLYAFSGQTSSHTANHFATALTIGGSTIAVVQYFQQTRGQVIGINDMSLVYGGVLDVGGNWLPPHNLHRLGPLMWIVAQQRPMDQFW